jgi:hypothetical protein
MKLTRKLTAALILGFWWSFGSVNRITGGWVTGRFPIRDREEVTEEKIIARLWAQTFTTGAVLSAECVGLASTSSSSRRWMTQRR